VFYFQLLKTFYIKVSVTVFFKWMVEINFVEVHCQPAKNIFEATIYFTAKNNLKE